MIEATLKELVDSKGCHLVLTTGGTGPAPRDVTPEATLAVADKVMPGFGEQMRADQPEVRADRDPFAPGRGDPRGRCLIINLPGQPKSIRETLEGLQDAAARHLRRRSLLHRPDRRAIHRDARSRGKAFRPKSALRNKQ